MEEINVTVVRFGDRKNLQMQYRDPITGKKKTRSSGTTNQRDAERAAAKWEAELREGRYKAPSKTTWDEFKTRYEDEVLASLSANTDKKVSSLFTSIERILAPKKLAELTASRISYYQSQLRIEKLKEPTIKGHLAHLQAALNWAKKMNLLVQVPVIEMPRRAKKSKVMKGRPITLEEFERILTKVAGVVHDHSADSWKHYLRGMWYSGLRLEESLELWWNKDEKLCVDTSGKRWNLRIPADLEKGNEDRVLPIAPEFEEFLRATPVGERTGRVFRPRAKRKNAPLPLAHRVGEIATEIGKAAAVVVSRRANKTKYASLHDFRRAFGTRWAVRVMPPVLQVLMRHESIETTMKYYVDQTAEAAADQLWAAVASNSSSNRAAEPPSAQENAPTQSEDASGLIE